VDHYILQISFDNIAAITDGYWHSEPHWRAAAERTVFGSAWLMLTRR